MYAVKVSLQDAQKAKQYLMKRKLLSHDYAVKRKDGCIYFPVTDKDAVSGFSVVNVKLSRRTNTARSLRGALSSLLTPKEEKELMTAFDTVGNVAIIEIPETLRKKEKLIAQSLLSLNPSITTVLRKVGIHTGTFRTQKMKWLAGKKTKEALYKEHGVSLFLDVEKVYFSPRLSTERKRIYKQVKKGESILVMFSGCAPYPCVLNKNTAAKEIYGVEINPTGHKYGLVNVEKNKIKNVRLFQGDVREVLPKIRKKFDRIVMPLPKLANTFLDVALPLAKPGATIHCYDFLHENDFALAKEKIRTACRVAGRKYRILRLVKCGQYSPRTYRVCVDFKVYS